MTKHRVLLLFRAEVGPSNVDFYDDTTQKRHNEFLDSIRSIIRDIIVAEYDNYTNPAVEKLNVILGDVDDGYAKGQEFWLGDVIVGVTVESDNTLDEEEENLIDLFSDVLSGFSDDAPILTFGNLSARPYDQIAYGVEMKWNDEEGNPL